MSDLLSPGDHIEVSIRKVPNLPSLDPKPGTVLAIYHCVALVEYTAHGHTSLVFVPANKQLGVYDPCWRNAYGYRALPRLWLQAIIDGGQEWIGNSITGPVPQPKVLLEIRNGRTPP